MTEGSPGPLTGLPTASGSSGRAAAAGTRPAFLPNEVDPTVFDEAFLRQLERLLLHHASAGARRPQGRSAERQARPIGRVRGLPRLRARRRPPTARLERLRPTGAPVRQAVHRGGGRHRDAAHRCLGVDGRRSPGQAPVREASGGRPWLHRARERGPCRGDGAGRADGPPTERVARLGSCLPAAGRPVGHRPRRTDRRTCSPPCATQPPSSTAAAW